MFSLLLIRKLSSHEYRGEAAQYIRVVIACHSSAGSVLNAHGRKVAALNTIKNKNNQHKKPI